MDLNGFWIVEIEKRKSEKWDKVRLKNFNANQYLRIEGNKVVLSKEIDKYCEFTFESVKNAKLAVKDFNA